MTDAIHPPALRVTDDMACPSGDWTLIALTPRMASLRRALADAGATRWDLSELTRLDSFGALLLWRAWGHRRPDQLMLPPAFDAQFARLDALGDAPVPPHPRFGPLDALAALGVAALSLVQHVGDFLALIGRLALDGLRLLTQPRQWPIKEFSANLFKVGVKAMPVSALVGFLIGVVLSYLSALQLKAFGADIFIVNILGLGVIRELGPVLVSVLVAGRSGSAMTAQLGVMRVTEEVDALSVMGISRYVRLVLPKVMALSVAMPLLVLWTSAVALLGGMMSAELQLGLSYGFFIETLPKVVPPANLFIALGKGAVFGFLIALVACHFGLRVKPNTESLSANTTASVVSSITLVILVDAVFAIATRSIGVPV
ncbi:ABC transporter permease [Denitromonas iodatirespirans]|uniref:ABC transporter permease n=1 Tax=Denitromonas iodatirespirans TaxID=2795389 RepID=A0A944DCT9_DENI1|nr:ABC transporter permease [Denitromonas iodatirespirans]MBT0961997.1 ABC transporter permease [Denitromonas iodatirespirans]